MQDFTLSSILWDRVLIFVMVAVALTAITYLVDGIAGYKRDAVNTRRANFWHDTSQHSVGGINLVTWLWAIGFINFT